MKKSLAVMAMLWGWALFAPQVTADGVREQVAEDYHLTLYEDVQGSIEGLELFTKQADSEAFFGVSCNMVNPFPMLQVLLFKDAVISQTPRLLKLQYRVDKGAMLSGQAVLQATQGESARNQIRLELQPEGYASMAAMQQAYRQWLGALKNGREVTLVLSHHALGEKQYVFSLRGFGTLLQTHESVCY